ncbi:hypothetical protein [Rhizobium rhizoryzae]|uniref:hypothetical protein n=1 Tax=Rhizobium rhizoryzae TaxID=451876 RepID=UPI00289CDA60|nr:hypothetical protein [Rhizobium rhizoryzae]
MGQMKELQIETHNLARDWEVLLENILSQKEIGDAALLKPDEGPSSQEEWQSYRLVPGLRFQPKGTKFKAAVDIKMFRWQNEWRRRVRDATSHMREILATSDFERGIIILTLELPDHTLAHLVSPADSGIEIWDISKLRELVEGNEELSNELEELVAETILDDRTPLPVRVAHEVRQGSLLATRLRQSAPGSGGWREFELLSEEAIRLLFGRELLNLTAQLRTDDGLNRMDLVGRIKSEGSSFWSMIASDFSTRYIVFDAKNFEEPITQSEIQITEKYLFAKGLRTVAVVIARNGADRNAWKLAETQLRENGKFIMVITLADLCSMLEGADAGDPPENLLFQRMDEMLMRMGR